VFPVRYEEGFYIPEDGILHSHISENLKSYESNRVGNFPLSSDDRNRFSFRNVLVSSFRIQDLGRRQEPSDS
jgi:hypothetical protein